MQKYSLNYDWLEITDFTGNVEIQSKDNSTVEYHKGSTIPTDEDNTFFLKAGEVRTINVSESLFVKSNDGKGILVISQGASSSGSSGIDYTSTLNAIKTSANNIDLDTNNLNDIKTILSTIKTSNFKRITNPTSFNLNSLATNMRGFEIFVETGTLTATIGTNTENFFAGYKLSDSNVFGLVANNIVLNGTCTLLISWEV